MMHTDQLTSLCDGHIQLTRELFLAGRRPATLPSDSLARVGRLDEETAVIAVLNCDRTTSMFQTASTAAVASPLRPRTWPRSRLTGTITGLEKSSAVFAWKTCTEPSSEADAISG